MFGRVVHSLVTLSAAPEVWRSVIAVGNEADGSGVGWPLPYRRQVACVFFVGCGFKRYKEEGCYGHIGEAMSYNGRRAYDIRIIIAWPR